MSKHNSGSHHPWSYKQALEVNHSVIQREGAQEDTRDNHRLQPTALGIETASSRFSPLPGYLQLPSDLLGQQG